MDNLDVIKRCFKPGSKQALRIESMLKEEVYADVLERYKKLNKKLFWRVFALEGKSKH